MLTKRKRVNSFKGLNLCMNNDLLCVKTRFSLCNHLPNTLILLSNKSDLTSLIIRQEHLASMHSSTKHTLSNLRMKYWIIQGKKTVSRALKSCFLCTKYEGNTYNTPPFALLPLFRIEKTFPFVNIGIDFAGPFLVKANITSRGKANVKAYICLFTCATSRAIHLEITLDLTTSTFLDAFKRFVATRGTPSLIYTDNGKTFECAAKCIAKKINGHGNSNFSCIEFFNSNITWNFIPPRSPWWGGFYERLVQTVKKCLRKAITDSTYNYFQFETFIKNIEGVVNARPLVDLQNDISQEIITPSSLVLGRRTREIVEQEELPLKESISRRKETINKNHEIFWNIFQKDYLLNLKEFKHKNRSGITTPHIGDIVHIKVENQPRSSWKLGKVTELIKGKDEIVRVVKVKTPLGDHCTELIRPVQHLYPLEGSNKIDQDKANTETSNNKQFCMFNISKLLLCFLILCFFNNSFARTNKTINCEKLPCLKISKGKLLHYNIYRKPEYLSIKTYICSRKITRCVFKEGFWGSKTHDCTDKYEYFSKSACLTIAYTKNSADGNLKRVTNKFFGTNNKIKSKYYWLSSATRIVKNTMLVMETLLTNGTIVMTNHPKKQNCNYYDGYCRLINKVMVWKSPCFNNIKLVRSELCHHLGKRVFCEETDFDVSQTITICKKNYISTLQGLYLQTNSTTNPLKSKKHYLNAAVIQHLTDRIDELEHRLVCLTHNDKCEMRNEYVTLNHHIIKKYNEDHPKISVSSLELDDLIRIRLKNITLDLTKDDTSSVFSFLPKFFSTGVHKFVTMIIMITGTILLLIVIVKIIFKLIKNRHSRRYLDVRHQSYELAHTNH